MTKNRLRVEMAGLGLVAEPHLKGYNSHPEAEVVAICDQDLERAKTFGMRHNIKHVFSSFGQMLEFDLDVVDIATPTHLHVPMTLKALRAGKHVHCEKPFCRSLA